MAASLTEIEVSAETHYLLRFEDGTLYRQEDGRITLVHLKTGNMFETELTQSIGTMFGLPMIVIVPTANDVDKINQHKVEHEPIAGCSTNESSGAMTTTRLKFQWSHDATLALIALFAKRFENSSKKGNNLGVHWNKTTKDPIWCYIAKELNAKGFLVSVNECREKFIELYDQFIESLDSRRKKDNINNVIEISSSEDEETQSKKLKVSPKLLSPKKNMRKTNYNKESEDSLWDKCNHMKIHVDALRAANSRMKTSLLSGETEILEWELEAMESHFKKLDNLILSMKTN